MNSKPFLLSELIKELEKAKELFGDLPVYKTIEEPAHEEDSNLSAIEGWCGYYENIGEKPNAIILCDSEDLDTFSE
jgi:hypothetical protein